MFIELTRLNLSARDNPQTYKILVRSTAITMIEAAPEHWPESRKGCFLTILGEPRRVRVQETADQVKEMAHRQEIVIYGEPISIDGEMLRD